MVNGTGKLRGLKFVDNDKIFADDSEMEAMLTWDKINWAKVQRYVYKLQKRIYQASKCGDIRKVRMIRENVIKVRG